MQYVWFCDCAIKELWGSAEKIAEVERGNKVSFKRVFKIETSSCLGLYYLNYKEMKRDSAVISVSERVRCLCVLEWIKKSDELTSFLMAIECATLMHQLLHSDYMQQERFNMPDGCLSRRWQHKWSHWLEIGWPYRHNPPAQNQVMALAGRLELDTLRRDEDKKAQSQLLLILQNRKPLQRLWRNIQTPSERLIQRVWGGDGISRVIGELIVSQHEVAPPFYSSDNPWQVFDLRQI